MISSCKQYQHKSCFFSRTYVKHGSPVKMMEAYVTVLTKGLCQSDENGSFLSKDYDIRKAYLAGSIKGETLQLMRSLLSIFADICLFLDSNILIINNNGQRS